MAARAPELAEAYAEGYAAGAQAMEAKTMEALHLFAKLLSKPVVAGRQGEVLELLLNGRTEEDWLPFLITAVDPTSTTRQ